MTIQKLQRQNIYNKEKRKYFEKFHLAGKEFGTLDTKIKILTERKLFLVPNFPDAIFDC